MGDDRTLNDARAELAAEQARLVAALTGGADAPAGFDADRVRAAADSLAAKRRRTVAKGWPALAGALGKQFAPLFDAYAAESPLPAGGPGADGRAFARWLDRAGRLPDAGRVMLLAAELSAARAPCVRALWLRRRQRWVVAVRLPWCAPRLMSIPFGWPTRRSSAPS